MTGNPLFDPHRVQIMETMDIPGPSRPSLTEFLLARIAEDEADAQAAGSGDWESWAIDSGDADHIARHDPARVLAEVEAKRRIVERFVAIEADDDIGVTELHLALMYLAAVYADHPDYRSEWSV